MDAEGSAIGHSDYQLACGCRGRDWSGFPGDGPKLGVVVTCGWCRTEQAVTWVAPPEIGQHAAGAFRRFWTVLDDEQRPDGYHRVTVNVLPVAVLLVALVVAISLL